MGTTSTYSFPYPEGSDSPQVHLDLSALAQAVDVALAANRTQRAAHTLSALTVDGTNNSDLSSGTSFTKPSSWAGYVIHVSGSLAFTMSAAAGVKYNVRFYDGGDWRTLAGSDGLAAATTINPSFAWTSAVLTASRTNLRFNFEVIGAGTGTTYASEAQLLFLPVVP